MGAGYHTNRQCTCHHVLYVLRPLPAGEVCRCIWCKWRPSLSAGGSRCRRATVMSCPLFFCNVFFDYSNKCSVGSCARERRGCTKMGHRFPARPFFHRVSARHPRIAAVAQRHAQTYSRIVATAPSFLPGWAFSELPLFRRKPVAKRCSSSPEWTSRVGRSVSPSWVTNNQLIS